MPKVYPNDSVVVPSPPQPQASFQKQAEQVLTVWAKSLLFNCRGFTVYDAKGSLVFRVDNYYSSNKAQVLMDAAGNPLLTIRRKVTSRLTLTDNWAIYKGETDVNPLFTVKKNVSFLNSKFLAHVTSGYSKSNRSTLYRIEGSYARRCCAVYDENRKMVSQIRQKKSVGGVSFGEDVFQLGLRPEINTTVAMALVILLEQMFGPK